MAQLLEINEKILASREISPAEKLMLARIASFADGCPMRYSDFTDELGLSLCVVAKGIKRLIEKQFIDEGKYGNYFAKFKAS